MSKKHANKLSEISPLLWKCISGGATQISNTKWTYDCQADLSGNGDIKGTLSYPVGNNLNLVTNDIYNHRSGENKIFLTVEKKF